MRVEVRIFRFRKFAVLIAETRAESAAIDKVLGDCGSAPVPVHGEVCASDDYQEHYIRLEAGH